jgi:hypothetical protein
MLFCLSFCESEIGEQFGLVFDMEVFHVSAGACCSHQKFCSTGHLGGLLTRMAGKDADSWLGVPLGTYPCHVQHKGFRVVGYLIGVWLPPE